MHSLGPSHYSQLGSVSIQWSRKILPESTSSENASTTTVATTDLQSESSTAPSVEVIPARRSDLWGIGLFRFRFRLANFRPGRDFVERRFSIAEATFLLIMAYLASRGLGVVRQTLFNALFSTGPEANAYYAAFRLPDTLFNLIAGGALVQAFVPVFVSFEKERGREETWRLTSLVFNVLLVTLTGMVLIAEFAAPAFVNHLLVTLAFPGVGIYGPTYGVLAGAACHVLVLLFGLLKQGINYTFIWDLKHPGLRQVMLLLGPNILVVGIGSIASIVNTAFTSYLPDKASLSAIHNALLLFDLPVALFGQALAQAALPRMSNLAVGGHFLDFRRLVFRIVGGVVLISIPTAVLLAVLGRPVIHILFQHGAFTSHSSALTALVLVGYAIGLPGQVASDLLVRSFYALKNALIPLLITIFAFAVRISLILFLLKILLGKYVILAIPLAETGTVTIEAGLLCLLLVWRLYVSIRRSGNTLEM